MKKTVFMSIILLAFALCANAQVVLPYLDDNLNVENPAATGWRPASRVSLMGGLASGKTKINDPSGDMIEGGDAAYGPDVDYDFSPLPYLSLVYKGESFGAAFYSTLGDGTYQQVEADTQVSLGDLNMNIVKGEKATNLYLSYPIGESISLGVGYKKTEKLVVTAASIGILNITSEDKKDENGPCLGVSVKLAEILYLAVGMHSVTASGSKDTNFPTSSKNDYVEASWTNMMTGVGVLFGKPGETRFRAEVSMISSPEQVEEAENNKLQHIHRATDVVFSNLEAQFGEFVVGYRQITKKENEADDDINEESSTTTATFAGIGWLPEEGASMSLYMINIAMNTETKYAGLIPLEVEPSLSGMQFTLGYTF